MDKKISSNSTESSDLNKIETTINLIKDLKKEKLLCVYCCNYILKNSEIWSCKNCFGILHLNCLEISEKTIGKIKIYKWECLICNDQNTMKTLPDYNCFCGNYFENKKFNKNFNSDLIPHGCGVDCGYLLTNELKCNIPCHPGPHSFISDKINFLGSINTDKQYKYIDNSKLNLKVCEGNLNSFLNLPKNELNDFSKFIVNLKGKQNVYGPSCDFLENVIYCGRQNFMGGWKLNKSIWANPFKVEDYGTNKAACKIYEEYLLGNSDLLSKLPFLVGKKLACWCYPEECHTEVILKTM